MKKITSTALGIAAGLAGYAYWSTKQLEVSNYYIHSEKIGKAWHHQKILQLSDLHSASFGRYNSKLFKKIHEIEPAMIFLTGDILDGDESPHVAIAFIRKLARHYPLFFVNGNHEAKSAFYPELLAAMKTAGVEVLANDVQTVTIDGDQLAVAGIEDPSFYSFRHPDLSKEERELPVLEKELERISSLIPPDTFTFLLAHRPEYWNYYQKLPIDLALSGHAHGGQVRFPGTEGLFAPGQGLFPTLTAGRHQAAGKTLIVSRGLGNKTWIPRVWNDPEMVVIHLLSE